MQNVLPVAYPPITAYAHHTAVLAIVSSDERYLPWFCGNYIQLCFTEDTEQDTDLDFFVPHKFTHHLPFCPLLEMLQINEQVFQFCGTDILAFIQRSVNSGYYLYVTVNCKELPLYSEFMRDRHHPVFLYGYDSVKEVLYGADFFQHGIYRFAEIAFSDFEKAFNSTIPGQFWWNGIKLLKRKERAVYEVDPANVKDLLADYLYSRDTSRRYRSDYNRFDNPITGPCLFGLDPVYFRLIANFAKLRQCEDTWYDPRVLPVFSDHKKALAMIADYLLSRGYMKSGAILDALRDIHQRSLVVRNLFLKYRARRNPAILEDIERRLAGLAEMERRTIGQWVDEVRV